MHILALSVVILCAVMPAQGWGQKTNAHGLPEVTPQEVYVVTAIRRASDVIAGPVDASTKDLRIGQEVSFGNPLKWLWGRQCHDGTVVPAPSPTISIKDPNLSDTQIAPSKPTLPDHRVNSGHLIRCRGSVVGSFTRIDRRTLIAQSPSGASYVILERPLGPVETATLQQTLMARKHMDGAANGVMDQRTRRGVASFARQLGAAYRFQNGTVTENLLAELGMGVPRRPHVGPGTTREGSLKLIKVVHYGPISAYFMGIEEPLVPRIYGVRELWFKMKGNPERIQFRPKGTLYFSDWYFDAVFSPNLAYVLLPQDRYGPYHAVRPENLRAYLRGGRGPDQVVGETRRQGMTASVHNDPKWLSDTEVRIRLTCCGTERTEIFRLPGR